MSKFDEVLNAIVSKLRAVPNIGVVQERERFSKNASKLTECYITEIDGEKRLQGWFVKRVSYRELSPMIGRTVHVSEWEITGYFAFDDEDGREDALNEVIDNIGTAFREDYTLGGLIQGHDLENNISGIQLVSNDNVMFANVLCHRAILKLHTIYYL